MADEIDAEAIVARARAEAEAITARAEIEAQAAKSRSEADAMAIRARARVEADELAARARSDRELAGRLLAEAEVRAARLIAEAESVRRSADDTIERLVVTRRELEAVIQHLTRLPNTVLDLTEHPAESPAGDASSPVVDVLGADALADPEAVPLGASVATGVPGRAAGLAAGGAAATPVITGAESRDPEIPSTDADDAVARMVRSAIDRAARAGATSPTWSTSPAAQREALRATDDDREPGRD
jgi:hypothetical protein